MPEIFREFLSKEELGELKRLTNFSGQVEYLEEETKEGFIVLLEAYKAMLVDRNRWRRPLMNLVAGGSEYYDNPDRCEEDIRRYQESRKKIMLRWKRERDAAEHKLHLYGLDLAFDIDDRVYRDGTNLHPSHPLRVGTVVSRYEMYKTTTSSLPANYYPELYAVQWDGEDNIEGNFFPHGLTAGEPEGYQAALDESSR